MTKPSTGQDYAERTVEIRREEGLHMRPAMEFVICAKKFKSQISIHKDTQVVDGKSIMEVFQLIASRGTQLRLCAQGGDAAEAVEILGTMLEDGVSEEAGSVVSEPTVFLSYSHKDEVWKERLETHLKVLEKAAKLEVWDDRKINVGDTWYPEIQEAMERATVAVCLISPDYLASDFILKEEVPYFLERRKEEGMVVIPILLRPCVWKAIPWLKAMQMIPRDGKTVSINYRSKWDAVFSEVAERIYEIVDKPEEYAPPEPAAPEWAAPEKVDIDRLPVTGAELFGRKDELELLDAAWEGGEVNVISFAAWGGVGKSTLVNKWLERMEADNYGGARRVFGWSFYSQGTKEQVTSADQFIAEALAWFGDGDPTKGTVWEKGERLAELVREEKTLLVLDGMEPLQSGADFEKGKIKDPGLAVLVTQLAKKNNGLCVITTREEVTEIDRYGETTEKVNLEQISKEAGRSLLRVEGVQGTDGELEAATEAFGKHALAVRLLASYLHDIEGHHIEEAEAIGDLDIDEEEGRHPRRVIEAWAKRLGEGAEAEVLHILGLFDRPAEREALEAVWKEPAIKGLTEHLQGLSEAKRERVFERLRGYQLLAKKSEHNPDMVDCHPLVREHFGERLRAERPGAWREANSRLYEYYRRVPEKEQPDTLEEMGPLLAAVGHGCAAGREQEALDEVYWKRIKRGDKHYSTRILGAFGADLAAVANFFERCWDKPAAGLTEEDKARVLSFAGFRLRALGRLSEAIVPFKRCLEIRAQQEVWEPAAINSGNLSELYLVLGEVQEAIDYGRQSVKYADESENDFQRKSKRSRLADALQQAGMAQEADELFCEAEIIQRIDVPEIQFLNSISGFQYCDFLLGKWETEEVKKRAQKTLEWAQQKGLSLLTRALDKLSLGRACLLEAIHKSEKCRKGWGNMEVAEQWLDEAVAGLREAGTQHYIPRGLLARAGLYRERREWAKAEGDLEEVREIAERGGMRLFLADYWLEKGRLAGARGRKQEAREAVGKAKELVEETGYHRRDGEVGIKRTTDN